MGKKGISIVKGIKVDELIKLLNKAYADEWLAYYQYFIEAKVIKGAMKDAAIPELNQNAQDELNHANMVADRIMQLGGTPLLHPNEWAKFANCAYEEPTDEFVLRVLEQAIKGEQCAIQVYSEMVDLTRDKDIVTYNMASQILADEVEHEEDLQDIYEDIESLLGQYGK